MRIAHFLISISIIICNHLCFANIQADILTQKGTVSVQLYDQKSPVTVANFANLARCGFYDGLTFHRVIASFMIQGGDPLGNGSGGPGYTFADEVNNGMIHKVGTLSMANSGPNTNGSQFFITHVPTPWLDGKHTVFGTVSQGQDVVNKIQNGDKIVKISIMDSPELEKLLKEQRANIDKWDRALKRNKLCNENTQVRLIHHE